MIAGRFTLDRYIGRTVVTSAVGALGVLVLLLTAFDFLDHLPAISRGRYGLADAALLTLLAMPRELSQVLSAAALLGVLLGLGGLASRSELVVMRATGWSPTRVLGSVLLAGLAFSALAAVSGQWLVPIAENHAQSVRAELISGRKTLHTRFGFWARDGQTYINIRDILPDASLRRVNIFRLNSSHELVLSLSARRAVYVEDHWQLKGVVMSRFSEAGIKTETRRSIEWESLLEPDLLAVIRLKPENLSAPGLFRYASYLDGTGQDARSYWFAFWSKVMAPINVLLMMMVVVPYSFSSQRSLGAGQRIVVGALLGLGFALLGRAMGHVGLVYNLSPIFSAMLPAVLLAVMTVWGMRRVR